MNSEVLYAFRTAQLQLELRLEEDMSFEQPNRNNESMRDVELDIMSRPPEHNTTNLDLDRMNLMLDLLGHPEQSFRVIHITGTNGKGSTSTFLSCVARAHGLKVGLYTSPHFVTPRERIRINGALLPADRWPVLGDRVMEAAPNLTYFEFHTALRLLAFAEAGVDLVVMEAGLGGHYDATTAMPVQAVCFTPIGMDHEKILGPTLTDIASDKSQAMRPGVPAFTAPQEAEALDCLLRTAQE